jgi:hypothetical protein
MDRFMAGCCTNMSHATLADDLGAGTTWLHRNTINSGSRNVFLYLEGPGKNEAYVKTVHSERAALVHNKTSWHNLKKETNDE